jgi:hypothetical protein
MWAVGWRAYSDSGRRGIVIKVLASRQAKGTVTIFQTSEYGGCAEAVGLRGFLTFLSRLFANVYPVFLTRITVYRRWTRPIKTIGSILFRP